MTQAQNDRWILRRRSKKMSPDHRREPLVERKVTYVLEVGGRFIIVENVPTRVNVETGEQYFAPEVVERLQQTIWEEKSLEPSDKCSDNG